MIPWAKYISPWTTCFISSWGFQFNLVELLATCSLSKKKYEPETSLITENTENMSKEIQCCKPWSSECLYSQEIINNYSWPSSPRSTFITQLLSSKYILYSVLFLFYLLTNKIAFFACIFPTSVTFLPKDQLWKSMFPLCSIDWSLSPNLENNTYYCILFVYIFPCSIPSTVWLWYISSHSQLFLHSEVRTDSTATMEFTISCHMIILTSNVTVFIFSTENYGKLNFLTKLWLGRVSNILVIKGLSKIDSIITG